jgi:hypothetical protein
MTQTSHLPGDPAVEPPADVVDDGTSDVMAEDEVVHISAPAAELAESIAHHGEESAFIADVPDWDEQDPLAPIS